MSLPGFETLTPGATLRIPLCVKPALVESVRLVEETSVEAHQALASGAVENAHLPLAPTSGKVGTRCEIQLTSGLKVPALPFRLDQAFSVPMKPVETGEGISEALREVRRENLASFIERLRAAGIHAHRTACPGLLEQLLQALKRPVDVVLCAVLDSDPNAPLQSLLAATYPVEFSTGVAALAKLTNASRAAAAVGTMQSRWGQRFRKRLEDQKVNEISLTGDYPLSDPTLLLYATVGRKLRPFRLPTDQGVIVVDAAAAVAVGRYLLLGEPMTRVPIALHDWRTRRTRFLIVPVGTPLLDLLNHCQTGTDHLTLRGGDSLRDLRITADAVIAGSELVVHVSMEEPAINPNPCIRCGWCVEVCPTGVQPAGVLEAAQRKDQELAERMGLEACIECGLCSFVCPSQLPLLQAIREVRGRVGNDEA